MLIEEIKNDINPSNDQNGMVHDVLLENNSNVIDNIVDNTIEEVSMSTSELDVEGTQNVAEIKYTSSESQTELNRKFKPNSEPESESESESEHDASYELDSDHEKEEDMGVESDFKSDPNPDSSALTPKPQQVHKQIQSSQTLQPEPEPEPEPKPQPKPQPQPQSQLQSISQPQQSQTIFPESVLARVLRERQEYTNSLPKFKEDTFASFLSTDKSVSFNSITSDGEVLKAILVPGTGETAAPLHRVYISIKGIAHFLATQQLDTIYGDESENVRDTRDAMSLSSSSSLNNTNTDTNTNTNVREALQYYNLDLPPQCSNAYSTHVEIGNQTYTNSALVQSIATSTLASTSVSASASLLGPYSQYFNHIDIDNAVDLYGKDVKLPILFIDSGDEEVDFVLGHAVQARGVEIALATMKVGETSRIICSPSYGYSKTRRPKSIPSTDCVFEFIVTLQSTEHVKNLHEMELREKLLYLNSRRQKGKDLFQRKKYATAYAQYEKAATVLEDPEVLKTRKVRNKVAIMFLVNQASCKYKLQEYSIVLTICAIIFDEYHDEMNQKAIYFRAYAYKHRNETELALRFFETLQMLLQADVEKAKTDKYWNTNPCICVGVEFLENGDAASCDKSCSSTQEKRDKYLQSKQKTLLQIEREIKGANNLLLKQHRQQQQKMTPFFEKSESGGGLGGSSLYDDKPYIAKSVQGKRDITDAMAFNAALRDPNNKVPWYVGVWNITKLVCGLYGEYISTKFDEYAEYYCGSRHSSTPPGPHNHRRSKRPE